MSESFRKNILSKPFYWVCIGFVSCLSYLFDMVNRTLSVDDLSKSFYVGKEKAMIASTRWGMQVWNDLLSFREYTPFLEKFSGVVFFIIAAVLFSRLLYIYLYQNKYCLALCTIFSCMYISFPLINEIWNYNGANMILAGSAMIDACVILLLYDKDKLFSRYTLLSALLLSLVVSSYEASAFLYVTVVLCVILLDYVLCDKKNWLKRGMQYAIPLVLAVVLRFVIGIILLRLLKLQYKPTGQTTIHWGQANTGELLVQTLSDTLNKYFARGLISFPIFVFVTACFSGGICAAAVSIKKKDFTVFLLSVFVFLSLFFQAFIQGSVMPYRTAQPLQFFDAFAITMAIFALTFVQKRAILTAAFVLFGYLTYRQGTFLNMSLALNNQRSDNEAAIIYHVGTQLRSNFEEKPVVFVGNATALGDNIERQITPDRDAFGWGLYRKIAIKMGWDHESIELFDTNVNPLLDWSSAAFKNQELMKDYFSYYGFDITTDPIPLFH